MRHSFTDMLGDLWEYEKQSMYDSVMAAPRAVQNLWEGYISNPKDISIFAESEIHKWLLILKIPSVYHNEATFHF